MHFIHTFVLRLLYDPQDPETLRGSLQAVSEKEVYPFVGEKNLYALAAGLNQVRVEEAPSEDQTSLVEGNEDTCRDQNLVGLGKAGLTY